MAPVCDGLRQGRQESLSALAQVRAETVAEAKQQIADAQADLAQGAAESVATAAVVAGVTTALEGLAESLAPLGIRQWFGVRDHVHEVRDRCHLHGAELIGLSVTC